MWNYRIQLGETIWKFPMNKILQNIKINEELFYDYYLNKIAEISMKYHDSKGINIFIQSMFYLESIDEYDKNLFVFNMIYGESIEKLNNIYNIFRSWLPFEKHDLTKIRGVFLELLTYKCLLEVFEDKYIHRESKLIIR